MIYLTTLIYLRSEVKFMNREKPHNVQYGGMKVKYEISYNEANSIAEGGTGEVWVVRDGYMVICERRTREMAEQEVKKLTEPK